MIKENISVTLARAGTSNSALGSLIVFLNKVEQLEAILPSLTPAQKEELIAYVNGLQDAIVDTIRSLMLAMDATEPIVEEEE